MALEIVIAAVPDREKVVAEIWVSDEQLLELSNEQQLPELEIYPRRGGQPCRISLDDLEAALRSARIKLSN